MERRESITRATRPALLALACASALLGSTWAEIAVAAPPQQPQQRFWIGPEGEPLPFRDDAEIKEFLRTADVVRTEHLSVGVTDPLRLTLERNGVRVDAVFRHFEKTYSRSRLRDGRLYVNFTDSFRFEPAAYEIAYLLGMRNVPPAIARRIGGRYGTVQIWVYHARMESQRVAQRLTPPDRLRWERQRQQMILFDALIGNTDRNAGNVLIDGFWNIWLIDHTRAFYARARCEQLDDVFYVERDFWNRLRGLDRAALDARLDGLLSGDRIGQLLDRRDRVAAYIDTLIQERGEAAVLY